jgi:signal transduction histidine kinase
MKNNIFKKYYQVDTSDTRKHDGTGMGLVICKGLVEGWEEKFGLNLRNE